jgi:hypothetical protein
MRTTRRTHVLAALAALTTAVALTACSTAGGDPVPTATSPQPQGLTITDPWVKAADTGMTAAFGILENPTGTDVRIVSASSDAAATVELHEMAMGDDGTMVMRPKEGGILVEAGSSHELAPGGDHIMLMGVTEPIEPGDEVTLTLTAEDGSTLEVTAPARTFSGADENYEGGAGTGDMGDMSTESDGSDS